MSNRKGSIAGHKLLTVLIVLISYLPFPSEAQTADSLVAEAFRYNPKLQALEHEYEAAKYREGEFKDFPDPVISTGFFPLPVETRVGPQQLKIGISQSLPWNNVLENRANVAREEAERVYFKREIAEADLSLTIKQMHAQVWKIDKEIDILQTRFPILEAWSEVALSRMSANQGGASDVLQIQLFHNKVSNLIQVLEQEKKLLVIRLNRLLGGPQIDTIVTGSMELSVMHPESKIDTNSMNNLPDMEWYDQEMQISEAIIQRNNTEDLPTIGIGLDYVMVGKRSDADPQSNGRDIVMPMMSVKVPLYRQKYKAVEQREKSRQIAISLRKEDKRLEIKKNIREALVLIEKEQNNQEFYDEQLEILDRTIDILLTEYSTKGNQFDELLKLQNQRIDFALKQLQSTVNIYLARLIIERWQP